MFRETNETRLGVVVRDHEGRVMASMFEKIRLPSSSDEVEAMATVRAISFTLELHLPFVIVEGDSELFQPYEGRRSPFLHLATLFPQLSRTYKLFLVFLFRTPVGRVIL